VPLDDPVELGIDAHELLMVQFDRGAQLADLAIDLVDLLLQLGDIRPALVPQAADLLLHPQKFRGDFLVPGPAERLGDGGVKPGYREGLGLDLAGSAALRAPVKKAFDLVPAGDEEEEAADPGGELNRGRDLSDHSNEGLEFRRIQSSKGDRDVNSKRPRSRRPSSVLCAEDANV